MLTMRSFRLTNEQDHPVNPQTGLGELVSSGRDSIARPVTNESFTALATPSNSHGSTMSLSQDSDSVLQQFQPQHWLTPGGLLWDQWDSFLANTSTGEAFENF